MSSGKKSIAISIVLVQLKTKFEFYNISQCNNLDKYKNKATSKDQFWGNIMK